MELVVVLRASEEQEQIAQSRCLRLTGTDIYNYIQMGSDAITCLALQLGNKITLPWCFAACIVYSCLPYLLIVIPVIVEKKLINHVDPCVGSNSPIPNLHLSYSL